MITKLPRSPQVKVEVTDEIMQSSKQRHSSHCMVAEAVKVAFPGAKAVAVDVATIRFTDPTKGFRYTYLTPYPVQQEIVRFDQGEDSQPFKFTLRRGQVTRAGFHGIRTRKPLTEAQEEQREGLGTAQLVARDTEGKSHGPILPDRIGGRTPPRAIGSRREFGLRAMKP